MMFYYAPASSALRLRCRRRLLRWFELCFIMNSGQQRLRLHAGGGYSDGLNLLSNSTVFIARLLVGAAASSGCACYVLCQQRRLHSDDLN